MAALTGASRLSYAAAADRLDELAAGAAPAELRSIGDEVLAVSGLLADHPRLRRVLSDPARSGADRADLLRDLLGSRIGRQSQDLLGTLVAGRWSAVADLRDAVELLGVEALLASAELEPARQERVGQAGGGLAEAEDELFRFGQVTAGDPALAAALGDRTVPVRRRAELADALLAGKVTEITLRVVRVALGGFGGRSVAAALTRLVELAAHRRDRTVAYVTAATPLTDEAEQRLGRVLSARYGRDVAVKTTVDPQVLGGVRVQLGADLYDGTIARRLAQARNTLVGR